MKKRKYHGFIPKVILLILLVIGSLSASFNKPQNHIVLADKSNNIAPPVSNISKCIQEIDLSNSAKNTHTYNLRTYNENSQNLLIKSNEAYYTLILTDLQESKNVVTLLDKKNIKLINNVIIIGTNSNVLKSIKYKNMYLLNDKSNLNLTLSTLGEESKLQSLSIYYNKNAEPSTKVIMRTKNNIKNTTQKSSESWEVLFIVVAITILLLMFLCLFYNVLLKPKHYSFNLIELLKKFKNTWTKLKTIYKFVVGISYIIICVEIFTLNGCSLKSFLQCALTLIVGGFLIKFVIRGDKLLKSIDDEKFSDISITIMCLFGIIVYCITISLFINMATAEFLATHKKIISLILYICLIGTYMFNMQILYTLTIYRSQIIKKNTEKSQFLNFCALAVFVIICFTCIFISTNLLLWYNDPSNFKNSSSDPYDIFDIIYYSISTFLTFCAENINANTVLSKLTCLLSKITTIISITVLLSVVTGSLPDNKNTDEECKTDKKTQNQNQY